MARYGDLDAVKLKVQRYLIPNTDEVGMVDAAVAERWFLKLLDEAPTADVVQKSEVEKIFEEIDNWFELYSEREYSFAEEETSKGHLPEAEAHDYALDIIKDLRQLCVAEIEKKYTEEKS